ncbi:hypothetical protein L3X14_17045 [Pseudomonas balearica]|uniref:hypothetical protein n=1 Tax=Stutzerimonas balearica TaxID=74829 RepID=UPI001F16B2FF|nr:hypothetical protein [Stutzerimonas balearica]MCF6758287.1 hypothetical protein [Stutzerimonas balearica]
MAKTLIEFQDHGQDFLWWIVDEDGKVTGCGPFQSSVWCHFTISNLASLKVGSLVYGVWQGELTNVNYPVRAIQPLVPVEVSVRMVGDGYVTSTVRGKRVSCTHGSEYPVKRLAEKLFPGQATTVEQLECKPIGRLHSKWRIVPEVA